MAPFVQRKKCRPGPRLPVRAGAVEGPEALPRRRPASVSTTRPSARSTTRVSRSARAVDVDRHPARRHLGADAQARRHAVAGHVPLEGRPSGEKTCRAVRAPRARPRRSARRPGRSPTCGAELLVERGDEGPGRPVPEAQRRRRRVRTRRPRGVGVDEAGQARTGSTGAARGTAVVRGSRADRQLQDPHLGAGRAAERPSAGMSQTRAGRLVEEARCRRPPAGRDGRGGDASSRRGREERGPVLVGQEDRGPRTATGRAASEGRGRARLELDLGEVGIVAREIDDAERAVLGAVRPGSTPDRPSAEKAMPGESPTPERPVTPRGT